ncbi:MAG: carboxypeptidase regulatory-like domain-containing protein [Eggerthellaceae bacterium]|nr:carboxypeptidase regulatory-like domain-containing protein [Eggerthellaceae bacterium]
MLDDGWTVSRCVDACAVGGLRFGDAADFADELAKAERLDLKSNVYYLNLPKRWVAGQVIDPEAREVIVGATVTMQEEGDDTAEVFKTTTDEFGDFWFRQIEGKKYHLWFEAEGYVTSEESADATEADDNMGRIGLCKMIPLG